MFEEETVTWGFVPTGFAGAVAGPWTLGQGLSGKIRAGSRLQVVWSGSPAGWVGASEVRKYERAGRSSAVKSPGSL